MRFLERVVDSCMGHFGDLSDVIFILPGRRTGTFLKKIIVEKNRITQWAPKVISFNELASEHTGIDIADGITLRFELYKAYTEIKKDVEDFASFDAWSSIILSDYNAIDNYLLDPKKIYEDLRNIKDIDEWSFNLDPLSDDQKKFLDFWNILGKLHDQFVKNISTQNLAYSGMLMRALAEDVNNCLPQNDKKKFCFAGFNAISDAEAKVILHCQEAHDTLIFWDVDKFYMDDKQHPAGQFVRKLIPQLGNDDPIKFPDKIAGKEKTIHLTATPNPLAQCRMIGNILSEQDEHTNTAIVLADESLLIPTLASLPLGFSKVNITMGMSFIHSPLFKVFDQLIGLHRYASKRQESHGDYSFYHKDFTQCLQDLQSISQSIFNAQGSDLIIKRIQKENKIHITSAFLSKDEIAPRMALVKQLFAPIGSDIKNLIKVFINLAKTLAYQEDVDAINKVIAVQFEKALIHLQEANNKYVYLTNISGFQSIFRQISSAEKLSFLGEPLSGIQIMGMLETRALDFDKVILLGANEGVLPGARRPNSFFPYELKKYYGIPSHKDHEAVFSYYFYRLIQHPKEVHLIFGSQRDDFGGGGEKSRFVSQLEYEHTRKRLNGKLIKNNYKTKVSGDILKNITIQNTKKTSSHILDVWQKSGLSPSAITRYINCPLDFYNRYVLGLKEENELEDEVNNAVMGTCIHNTLELLYKDQIEKKLTLEAIDEMKKLVKSTLTEQFRIADLNELIRSGQNHLIYLISEQMVNRMLATDKQRINSGDSIIIKGLEKKYTAKLSITLAGKNEDILLRGTVDRIEEVNGEIIIMDYKSGRVEQVDVSVANDKDFIKKPKSLQLTQYMWLFIKNQHNQSSTHANNIRASILSLPKTSNIAVPLKYSDKEYASNKEFLDGFENTMASLLEEILDPNIKFEHNDKANYCEHCLVVQESIFN